MAQSGLINTSIDNELLQSFVRVHVGEPQSSSSNITVTPTEDPVKIEKSENALKPGRNTRGRKKPNVKKTHGANLIPKKRRQKCKMSEELYTDKDRAAAVNMGTKDIKQSLKLKRIEDRSRTFLLPEEADPALFLALGNYEMTRRDLNIALIFINKALELNPLEKNALVARSKCHILLGQPDEGLKDAESALRLDKTFLKAIYQKAESLYYLGDFEHSLMYFHRGLHIRPDHDGFKTGVEKAQKAIENALGIGVEIKKPASRSATPASRNVSSLGQKSQTGSIASAKNKPNRSNRLLRELAVDKEYLDALLKNPDIKDSCSQVMGYIEEAVDYLAKRQEFWRQQLPPKKKK